MLLAIANHLRCADGHEPTWLVARADRVEGHRMVEGVLGCPLCGVERAVQGGVLWWSAPQHVAPAAGRDIPDGAVTRLGALLGFGESAAPFVLCGVPGAAAAGLAMLAEAPIVAADPPDDRAVPFVTIVRGAQVLPLAAGVARGIAIDAVWAAPTRLASCVAALVPGGRLVAPATIPLPDGLRELARDTAEWIAERVATPARVPLARARRG
jgi:hypothetical protein